MTGAPEDAGRRVSTVGFETMVRRQGSLARSLADLGPRAASGLVLVALALVSARLGGEWFAAFWLAAAALLLIEWLRIVSPRWVLVRFLAGAAPLALAARLMMTDLPQLAIASLACGAILVALLTENRHRAWSGAGVLYAGTVLVCALLLRNSGPVPVGGDDIGFAAILWLFAVVWSHDVMAYFGGRLIGGPKFWPRISPSKTWAGTIAGVLSGAIAGAAMNPVPGAAVPGFVLGLLCAFAAAAGDIFESSVKRRFGRKDSSHIIPGHGGVMDRLDGFAAAALLAAVVGVTRHGFDFAAVGLFYW